MSKISSLLCLCILFLSVPTSLAQATSRGAFVEEIVNERSSFAVRVDVNRKDRIYARGDCLTATVESSEDGYLYLLYRDADGKASVLFPNLYQADNFILKNKAVTVPAPGNSFHIYIGAPFGNETLKAVVSKKPLSFIDLSALTRYDITPVDDDMAKNFSKTFEKETPDWAEHQVPIRTVAQCRRFAVGIGISDYKDVSFGKLGICHVDAEHMLDLFKSRCGIAAENAILITNKNATLATIRKAIKEELPRITQPGDTVLIFWSGHGGRTEDGKREFLIPYDGTNKDIDGSMLMDETFGRWIQELDGRRVLVVIDACHSGGQANRAKGWDDDWKPLRFAFTRLAMSKDIGQKDTAMIASSTSDEVSFVRKERDLSVLTFFFLQAVNEANKPLTHVKLVKTIKPLVAKYVEDNFANRKQTVVMQDDMVEPIVLNP